VAQTLGRQLLRSGTSVAANFREASRARTDAEFISKLGIVEQELDETSLWIELLVDSDIIPDERVLDLKNEADALLRIIVASIRATRRK
jgi:four helix bundle protein